MASFTEKQIQGMLDDLRDEFGWDIATRELALLELEDMKRKGCALEYACKYDQCRGCSISDKCPVVDWEKRQPEYANDELAMRIEILEAGGEEAYKAKLKAQEEAKRKVAEVQKATDVDRADACRHLLNLFYKSKLTATEGSILDLINSIQTEEQAIQYLAASYGNLANQALNAAEAMLYAAQSKMALEYGSDSLQAQAANTIVKGYENSKLLSGVVDIKMQSGGGYKEEKEEKEDKYSKDFEWIERLLERLSKATEKITKTLSNPAILNFSSVPL